MVTDPTVNGTNGHINAAATETLHKQTHRDHGSCNFRRAVVAKRTQRRFFKRVYQRRITLFPSHA
jgi:hypothetical protein